MQRWKGCRAGGGGNKGYFKPHFLFVFHRFDFVSLLFFMDKTVKTIPRPLHSNFIQFAYRSVVLTFLDFTLQHRDEDGKRSFLGHEAVLQKQQEPGEYSISSSPPHPRRFSVVYPLFPVVFEIAATARSSSAPMPLVQNKAFRLRSSSDLLLPPACQVQIKPQHFCWYPFLDSGGWGELAPKARPPGVLQLQS